MYCVTLHPTIDVLITGGRDSVARVWDMRTRHAVHVLTGHKNTVMSVAAQAAEPQVGGWVDRWACSSECSN